MILRPPTIEDLDNDSVIVFNRDALLQKQFDQDHVKGILMMQDEIKKIETKLAETKQQQVTDQAQLEKLRTERAKVSLKEGSGFVRVQRDKKLAELDQQIKDLDNALRFVPDNLKELEKQLAEAKEKFAAEARDELLNKQKEVTSQAKELSKQLVAQLKSACEINQQLQTVYDQYKQLHQLTKVDFLGAKFAEPSLGLLNYLYEFLRGELEEGKHCRMAPPGDLPPL